MAMSQVSLHHRIDMGLILKPTLPSPHPPNLNNKRKPDGQGGPSYQPGLTKSEREKKKLAELKKKRLQKVLAKGVEQLPP